MIFQLENSLNEQIKTPKNSGVTLCLKREDAIHPFVSGNKYRKLKYNLIEAEKQGLKTLVTFGGAYSNHIAAVASAGQLFGFKTVGVIRGEELANKIVGNATLSYAQSCGMEFRFISREAYGNKTTPGFLKSLEAEFQKAYFIPEGGTNTSAIRGCEEILTPQDADFDYICCAVGTGGTISGLINSSEKSQQILGFPALKGDFLQQDISKFANQTNWSLITDYHFGGYAKINPELVSFINEFKVTNNIALDPVYTGKMMFGIADLIQKNYFPKGSKILAIHTGGLQGISGMNTVLKKKNLPLIE
ncbi:1-aminocyclopropane-1-carboxylate deaminase/D-cysteine desulfhydrase [Algibacter miyuki]|uniref:1-aminocyclopropane-1-carboxylate deaminase/D-cysteine desulfhydrase n=1 Tax=Algibacter miyuki TaxID=1306933 RepID=A0ABV5GYR5_9FLAO|nr:pyridoxal-phosphate dependent enzyme [Algibacter miyuki]MDN3666087.1 pyridoxal-phosphate dependent enzyme [Algibacter miyuki]